MNEATDGIESLSASPLSPAPGRAIGIAAVIIMLGNLSTSFLGFVRQAATVDVFGTGPNTAAWFAASIVPQMFYDLTIGAAISAALIPTFTAIAEGEGADELARTVGAVLALAWTVLAAVVLILIAFAGPLMNLLLHAYPHQNFAAVDRSIQVVRLLLPSLFFLGTSAVLLSALYSMKRFTVPAFATMFYHLGIIGGAVILARPLGILALPVGAVAGAALQAGVQVPALLRAGVRPRLRLTLSPTIRRVLRLYLPVAAGLLVSVAGQIIDLNYKASLGTNDLAWMSVATTLVQFPIGIGVAALGFAILPSISSDAAFGRPGQFKDTLATGIRLVLFLTVPAAIGFLAVGTPIIRLILEHHRFHPTDTAYTVKALTGYCLQIPFVGVDQLLIFAFYARKNTVTPMIVGVLGVLLYVVIGYILKAHLHIFGLALANSIQNSAHGLVLLGLLIGAIGPFGGRSLLTSIARTLAAGIVMGILTVLATDAAANTLGVTTLTAKLVTVGVAFLVAAVTYIGTSALVRSQELTYVVQLARSRLAFSG